MQERIGAPELEPDAVFGWRCHFHLAWMNGTEHQDYVEHETRTTGGWREYWNAVRRRSLPPTPVCMLSVPCQGISKTNGSAVSPQEGAW